MIQAMLRVFGVLTSKVQKSIHRFRSGVVYVQQHYLVKSSWRCGTLCIEPLSRHPSCQRKASVDNVSCWIYRWTASLCTTQ